MGTDPGECATHAARDKTSATRGKRGIPETTASLQKPTMQHDSGTAPQTALEDALAEQELVLPSSCVHWQVQDVPATSAQLTARVRELHVTLDEQLSPAIVFEALGWFCGSLIAAYRGSKAAH
jgi:hypothetical protein